MSKTRADRMYRVISDSIERKDADEALMRQALEALSTIYREVIELDDAFSARQIVRYYGRDVIDALRDRLGEKE